MTPSPARLVLILAILLSACNEDGIDFSQTLDVHTFTLKSPPGWVLEERVGFDSYVGVIRGPIATIHYDQGLFSFPGLDNIEETERTVYLKRITVDGLPAIVHKERVLETNTDATEQVSFYIEGADPWKRNRLYINDPSPFAEIMLMRMVKTHRFK